MRVNAATIIILFIIPYIDMYIEKKKKDQERGKKKKNFFFFFITFQIYEIFCWWSTST